MAVDRATMRCAAGRASSEERGESPLFLPVICCLCGRVLGEPARAGFLFIKQPEPEPEPIKKNPKSLSFMMFYDVMRFGLIVGDITMFQRLSSIDAANTKVAKSEKSLIGGEKIRILSLSLMPDDIVCPARWLADCKEDCLRSSGRGIQQNVIDGRQARTDFWHADRDAFLAMLKKELHNFIKLCGRQNVVPVTRLNVLSDIPWENYIDFADEFRALFSYDYTKRRRA
jgi:hypothetical protein